MEQVAFTVKEFCTAHRISKTLFYDLAKRGTGPVITKVGRKTIVSVESAKEWQRRMESQSQ